MTDTKKSHPGISRRDLLSGTVKLATLTGLGGTATGAGLGAALGGLAAPRAAQAATKLGAVEPGDLDDYYVFSSSGQTGEVRILGLPSMRELMRIPVFNRCSATGWGITNESIKVLTEGLTPETKQFLEKRGGLPAYMNGDAHHPHMSFTDGTYDGRYLWIQDKANTRVARIRCDVMKCDKIIEVPNASDMHGMRPQKFPRTGYVFVNAEHRIPIPNDGTVLDEPEKYHAVFTAVDGDAMTVAWQVLVDGNLDNLDADYQGKYAFSTCYNSEEGTTLAEMMANEQDWVVVFNIPRIEEAVKKGDFKEIHGVPVLDGRHGSPYTRYIPISKSPHGINTAPDGIHVVANGKLSPTVSVIDVRLVDALFEKDADPRSCIVAEPDVTIRDLTIRHSGIRLDKMDAGVFVGKGGDNAVIENNVLEQNLFGVYLWGPDKALVRGNRINGRRDLRMSERGNGVSVWNSPGSVVEGNDIRYGRDGIFTEISRSNAFTGNRFRDLRFGIHYMYTNDSEVSGNVSLGNHVGYALMFSRGLTVTGNLSQGDRDHGIALNYANGSRIVGNVVRKGGEKCVFIYNSNMNRFEGNRFQDCEIGIHFTAGSERNLITGNAFIDNQTQVKYVGTRFLDWSHEGHGNYWSDNPAFDLDGDGIADTAYRPNDIVDRVVWTYPLAKLLLNSPAVEVVRWAQSQFPALHPGGVIDSAPLMHPPEITVPDAG